MPRSRTGGGLRPQGGGHSVAPRTAL